MSFVRSSFFAAAALILIHPPLFGQRSTIQGLVTDPSGAAVPGAAIKVTNLATGESSAASSNQSGLYSVPLLNQGAYRIDCTARGFAPQQRPNLPLEVGQTARVDFTLNVGSVTEVIDVSAAGTLIQSETTEVGQVIDNKRIVEMPLNGRNYLELGRFTVGVLPARQGGKGSRQGIDGGFQAVGLNPMQNNVLLDGADNSSRGAGGGLSFEAQSVKPSIDAVAEFKVITNNTSAEYGYRSGAKVLVSTKSGTNEFHGTVFEFLRNDKLDGTNFFANRVGASKPHYRQNQFGGTLGGPVIKNKTFFFGSYQGTRIRLGKSFISSVPSREVLSGNFNNQPAVRRNIFDPLSISNLRRTAFPNNVIPASRFDPVAKKVADFYPAPNIAGRDHQPNNFFYGPADRDDANQYDFRADHNLNDSHRFFIRYSLRDQLPYENGNLPLPADGAAGQLRDISAHSVASSLSSVFGARLHNELRFGYSLLRSKFNHLFTEPMNAQLGIKGAPGDAFNDGANQGYSRFAIAAFSQLGPRQNWPNDGRLDQHTIGNTLLWQAGRHGIKFGAEHRHVDQLRDAQRFRRGFFNMTGVYTSELPENAASRATTGNGMADMLLGWANNGTYGNAQGENVIENYFAAFIQDDFKVTRRLTINMGLRWELFREPTYPNPDAQTSVRWLTELNGITDRSKETHVFPTDARDCGCVQDWNNFGPRLGLAYRLTEKTVLRAGGGIYFGGSEALGEYRGRFFTGAPRHVEINLPQLRTSTELYVQTGFPPFKVTGQIPPGTNIKTTSDKQPTMYSGQWFFDLQQQLPMDTLVTLAYMGQSSSHLVFERNLNQPYTPHPTILANSRRIRTQFNQLTNTDPLLNSNYNALTVKAEKRFSRGFTFLSSFTWSHNIDFTPERWTEQASSMAHAHNLSLERGNSDLDRRLAYNLSWVYELPFGRGKKWMQTGAARHILGDWEVGGILSLLSGTPADHSFNVDNQNLGGRVRGDRIADPNLPGSERTIDRWFNTAFLRASAPGVISNAGRNLIYGPGVANYDLILAKRIRMPWEGHHLQFRFESFNLSNTPAFGPPNTGVGNPAAGTITEAGEPRRIQFGLKYNF
jgi:hypothetical protein